MDKITQYIPEPKIPEWIQVNYNGTQKWVLKCIVDGKDYEVCENPEMWSSSKPGEYGKGIANTEDDPLKVERTGKLGEMALAQIIQEPVDFEYRKLGDAYDFIIDKYTVDIKTATKLPSYNASLITAVNENGKMLDIKCDYYVAAYINHDDRQSKRAEVIIVGVMSSQQIKRLPRKPAKKGKHLNYEMSYSDPELSAEKIRLMVDLIKNKK
jgi:hypothetical protein